MSMHHYECVVRL